MPRYREQDAFLFSGLFKRAEELTDDPLQQMLIFVKLLAEMMANLEGLHPGCLVDSFTYESHQVNEEVKKKSPATACSTGAAYSKHKLKKSMYATSAEVKSTVIISLICSPPSLKAVLLSHAH